MSLIYLCSAVCPFPPFCFASFHSSYGYVFLDDSSIGSCRALKTIFLFSPLGCFKPTFSFSLKQNLSNLKTKQNPALLQAVVLGAPAQLAFQGDHIIPLCHSVVQTTNSCVSSFVFLNKLFLARID